ncbi:MAG: hypothetical protein ABR607_09065 [Pyrinomonadaceae bacterium]
MKRCPVCSRTYANDAQKFCTQDGNTLVDAHSAGAGQGETVRIDSAQLDSEVTRVISKELPRLSGSGFDPYRTVMSSPQDAAAIPSLKTEDVAPQTPATLPPPAPTTASPQTTSTPPQEEPAPQAQPPSTPPPPVSSAQTATETPSGEASAPAIAPPTVAASAPVVAASPRAPKKRSKLPLILGILVVLLLLGAGAAVAGYFFVVKPMLEARRVVIVDHPRRPEPTPADATPDAGSTKTPVAKTEVPPYVPPARAVQFVNSSANLTGKLAEHYVDFSFYYPRGWSKDPKAGVPGATNFAHVERHLPPDLTQENLAVGWYLSAGSGEGDRATFHTLAENLNAQYAQNSDFADYRKVSEGPTTVGNYDGYEFRFEAASRNRNDIKIWGRVIFVPPVDGSNNGVTLLMFATSLAPELNSVKDVGAKGELPMILESFRFGK